MTPDDYILTILRKYDVDTGPLSPIHPAVNAVVPILRGWGGSWINNIFYSGSHAKGTAILGGADVDLFISLLPGTPETLQDLYNKLYRHMRDNGYTPKPQNVSIGITHNGVEMDLVPGIKYAGNTNDHWLYVSKSGRERTKTNVDHHISIIQNSGRINEIRAIKIWAQNHNLDFGSIYLELAVLDALSGHSFNNLSSNVRSVFQYFVDDFPDAVLIDPANSNNIISSELTMNEKRTVANQARQSLNAPYWGQILW